MRSPGFSAEAALASTSGHFGRGRYEEPRAPGLVPQLPLRDYDFECLGGCLEAGGSVDFCTFACPGSDGDGGGGGGGGIPGRDPVCTPRCWPCQRIATLAGYPDVRLRRCRTRDCDIITVRCRETLSSPYFSRWG